MTPAQLDHLRRIDAHLANLLSTAEKRTPGEWEAKHYEGGLQSAVKAQMDIPRLVSTCEWNAEDDATYIAACAGNAEAGWRATRAAIATALDCESWDAMIKEMYIRQDAEAILESILAAFPNV